MIIFNTAECFQDAFRLFSKAMRGLSRRIAADCRQRDYLKSPAHRKNTLKII